MKIIGRYVDELLDYFPVNRMTRTIRMDLLQAATKDYYRLLDEGMDKEEASNQIIEHIEGPEVLAKMIPDRHSIFYYIVIAISLGICYAVYQYISEPDFLQIFLPARMVFPDIVERLIQYLMLLYICYIVLCQLIRKLPQKLLNRTLWQSMLFLYIGTIMTALYFSISIAFIWFSFNGYADTEMIGGEFLLHFQFNFYKNLIEPTSMVYVYAFLNSLCFILSRQYYHLSLHPLPYHLDEIYHAFPLADAVDEPEPSLEEALTPEVNETISQLASDLGAVIDQKAAEPLTKTDEDAAQKDESEALETPSIEATDQQEVMPLPTPSELESSQQEAKPESTDESEKIEEITEEIRETKPEKNQETPESAPVEKKSAKNKKKNKNRKPVIQLANDRYKKKTS